MNGRRRSLSAAVCAVLALGLPLAVLALVASLAANGAAVAQSRAANGQGPAAATPGASVSPSLIGRGAYLAKAADCAGCHTAAPRSDTRQPPPAFAGGLAVNSPFGPIWSSNITPDPAAGIGRYSYEDFVRAVRDGVAPGGTHLYPAMPFPSFAKISDDDMRALYAYFMHGVEPVPVQSPRTHLPFPFNQRWVLAVWDEFFAPHERFQAREDLGAEWNRGAYLVQSLGHCGACHTPRGVAFQERGYSDADRLYLTGGRLDNWYAPNLTNAPSSGVGQFSADDIAAFLKHGHGGGVTAFGSMLQVVEDSGQYLDDADLHAIGVYLKSLAPHNEHALASRDPARRDATVDVLRTGAVQYPGAGIYSGFCAKCHHADGMGEAGKYPRLAGNPVLLAPDATSVVRLLIEGGRTARTRGGPAPQRMPSFGGRLTDTEVARVLTFVRNAWGNQAAPVTTREVARVRRAIGK
ncbi:cytochrome c [Trinickia caryophylli]|nr:cytochrome c [Trinickia caryophylli]PMS13084.1 alcohol dehydrogenase [Trinickia caryophylli]TRX14690.1 c-type cytochrome [Trinickia caryophylli]